jgi:S1-C subfamily serine protease
VPAPQQIAAQLTGPISAPIADVATRSIQPVVGIAVLKPDGNTLFKTTSKEEWGLGSGIIVDPNGYILTNNHVAGGKSKRIIVSLAGGENVDGRTLWADSVMDLAVVKIDVTGLPTAKLGDSNALRVGEPAIAIGNPLGMEFQRTVTSGIVSALNRTIEIDTDKGTNFMEDLIQTDASINPGNSGGPLMNSKGEVIGLNTVKVTSAEGIGFAIPINMAKPIINSFISKGIFNEPYLGVFAYDRQIIPYVDPTIDVDGGVYVAKIDSTGPAARSGIKIGDVIRKVDQTVVHTMAGLRNEINSRNPGDIVKLTVVSKGTEKLVNVTLGRKTKDGLVTR